VDRASALRATGAADAPYEYNMGKIIAAASVGTMIEWYDFYIFGSMAFVINQLFFPSGDNLVSLLATLATFATGFAVRPFGALVFGRIGDLIGRKYAFIVTVTVMGGATFLIGLLPTHATIGALAPALLVVLRLLQGLALGGEYGGAAVYVAEHAPDGRRGYFTSFIQTTATVGLFISVVVVLATRLSMSAADLQAWGWRIPFLLSIFLVAVSLYIRWQLRETPLFTKLKESGQASTNPLKDSFGTGKAWRLILTVLFGATAGQAVVWYAGQFYALTVLQSQLKVGLVDANVAVAVALLLGTPFFVVFGSLSDKIGRKPIIMAGMALALLTYVPLYAIMNSAVTPPPANAPAGTAAVANIPLLIAVVFVMVIYVTMVYGPIAAFLVETFPAKIRYTSMSLPYHLGNGWFGGLLPLICTAIYASTKSIYLPLLYPGVVVVVSLIVGGLFLRESSQVRIWDEVQDRRPGMGEPQPASLAG
jgi:MFS family permease